MTLREVYEYALIELNKRKAPSLLLKDYNYFIWKAFHNYENIRYNDYDKNQQRIDDLDALKVVDHPIDLALVGRYYSGDLPVDYLHILNCEVVFESVSDYLCYVEGQTFEQTAGRLPTGAAKHVKGNHYFKPSYKKPYFYSNISGEEEILEIRSGTVTKFVPIKAYIDYLKVPVKLELTQEQIDEVEDTSPVLEFSDYVCLQIVNELVKLLLENSSDPRIQSNIPVNQTIA